MHSVRAELKYLTETGSIVNAASICGLVGLKGSGAYCASKQFVPYALSIFHPKFPALYPSSSNMRYTLLTIFADSGVIGLTRATAKEMSKTQRINCVAP